MSEDGFIHVAKAKFTPQPHASDCAAEVDAMPEMGYGLAGGGFGAYGYCADCGAILWKTEDHGA